MQFAWWMKGCQIANFHHCHPASLIAMLVPFKQHPVEEKAPYQHYKITNTDLVAAKFEIEKTMTRIVGT
jgi:hypothetical protein